MCVYLLTTLELWQCHNPQMKVGFERYRYWVIGNWAIFAYIG